MKKMLKKALATFMAFAMVLAFMPALPGGSAYAATQQLFVKYINDSGSVVENNYTYNSDTGEVTAAVDLEGLTVEFDGGFIVNMDNFTNGVYFQAWRITNPNITINLKGDNVLTGTNQNRALLYSEGSSLGTIIIKADEDPDATLTINNTKSYSSDVRDNSAILASLLKINGGSITVNQNAALTSSTAGAYGVACSGRIEINNDASLEVNAKCADGSASDNVSGIWAANGVYYASSGDFNVTAPKNGLYSSPLYIAGTGNAYFEGSNKASDSNTLGYKNYGGSITRAASDYAIYGDKAKPALKFIYKDQASMEPAITSTDIVMTAPVSGEAPQTIINHEQYMGLISYSPSVASGMTFAEETAYTANISIVPKKGYSLDGLTVDDFTLAGASDLSYDASTGVLSGTFPETEKTSFDLINTELPVYIPVYGGNLWNENAFSINAETYTATLDWYMDGEYVNPDASQLLIGSNSELKANITITPKEGYTTLGVTENGYTIAGCPGAQVVNKADSSSLTVTFPRTASQVPLQIGPNSYGLLKGSGVQDGKTLPEGITYDSDNHIIIVDGYTGEAIILTPSSRGSAPDIHFSGDNKLSGYERDDHIYGIYCQNDTLDITFDEGASLDIDLGIKGSPISKSAIGIYDGGTYGDINISGGDIDIDIVQDGEGIAAGICGADCSISGDADVRVDVDADSVDPAAAYMTNEAVNSPRTFSVDTDKLFKADVSNGSADAYIYDLRTTTHPNAQATVVNHEAGTVTYDANAYRVTGSMAKNSPSFELRALHSVTYADSEKIAVSGQPDEGAFAYEDTVNVDVSKFAPSDDEYYLSGFALYALDDTFIFEILNEQFEGPGCDVKVKGLFTERVPLSEFEDTASLSQSTYTYDSIAKKPVVTIPGLTENEDFTVVYSNNINAGTATATVTGINHYREQLVLNYTIEKAPLTCTVDDISKEYGDDNPEFTVSYAGIIAGEDSSAAITGTPEFTTDAQSYSNTGEYDVTVSGLSSDNYDITYQKGTLTVVPGNAADIEIVTATDTLIYNGEIQLPNILHANYKNMDVIDQLDLDAFNSACKAANAGTHEYDISIMGSNFTGTADLSFIIEKAPLTIIVHDTSRNFGEFNSNFGLDFDGCFEAIEELGEPEFMTDAVESSPVGEYTIEYAGGLNLSNYDYIVEPGTLTVNKAAADNAVISLKADSFIYDGKEHAAEIKSITYKGIDVTDMFEIEENQPIINAGSSSIVLKAKEASSLTGSISKTFEVVPAELTVAVQNKSVTYGKAVPKFTADITGFAEGEDSSVLSGALKFTCSIPNGKPAGTYAIKASGLSGDNYTFKYISGKLTITPKDMSKMKATLSYTTKAYTGKALKPSVKISGLTSGKDFTLAYKNNTKVGTATVTITGNGNYKGKISKTFKIKPAKAAISKLTPGKKKLTVKMSKKAAKYGVSSFQIAYRVKGTSKWKYATSTSQTKTIKSLKKGKKYQIKVRAVKGKSYGAWSAIKTSTKVK